MNELQAMQYAFDALLVDVETISVFDVTNTQSS